MSSCCGNNDSENKKNIHCENHSSPSSTEASNLNTSNSCCSVEQTPTTHSACCGDQTNTKKVDWLLWGSFGLVAISYLLHLLVADISWEPLHHFSATSYEMVNTMFWGVLIGILMIGVIGKIPKEFVMTALGNDRGFNGLARATLAGVLLDLCSHGILMVGAKLYERGASIGQVMAFIIASPWNSFSLTIVLITLVGLGWTVTFILLSMLIALVSGYIFNKLVDNNRLPNNPAAVELSPEFYFWPEAKKRLAQTHFSLALIKDMFIDGLKDSGMVLRWLLFGIVLAAALRALLPVDMLQDYFGPTALGLAITMIAATVLEVCSEGSTPIAADILNRANAPGNGFAFLMGGVSTDYTEIMVLKEVTRSWKIALFLPLVTLPQIIVVALVINSFT